ncbi:MAG: hypothetical protein JXR41_10515 [Bacteroidales bacterium]|nr:hypothetical protein [Bacteroidales bacterium]MBN2763514.1 hypothetical protein [Bacteroidales bacterium]
MKGLMTVLLILAGMAVHAQEDYWLQINDTGMEIALDREYTIPVDGRDIKLKITARDTLLWDDDLFSFQYSKDYKVSRMEIDEGIEQVMLMTAEGSGMLIQEYATINPTMLNEMMIAEVTKESVNYGYKMERKDYKRVLKSGQKIDVGKAVLTYKDETNVYEVASIGDKDEGILIITMIMDESMSEQGKKIIDLMWNSLIYK